MHTPKDPLAAVVQEELDWNPALNATRIEVDAERGRIILRGAVLTLADVELAGMERGQSEVSERSTTSCKLAWRASSSTTATSPASAPTPSTPNGSCPTGPSQPGLSTAGSR